MSGERPGDERQVTAQTQNLSQLWGTAYASAALLVDKVLPEQPMRQWVLSFPFLARSACNYAFLLLAQFQVVDNGLYAGLGTVLIYFS